MKIQTDTSRRLTIYDISINPVQAVLSKCPTPNDYSAKEYREAELEISREFQELNKAHEDAQELIAQEMANIII